MSDDLVKQGRAVERDLNNGFPMTCERGVVIQQMADRIEELEAEISAVKESLTVAQAKLAKAVKAIENLPIFGCYESQKEWTRTTLAELKGEDRG